MRATISAGFLALTLVAVAPAGASDEAACRHALAKASDKFFVVALKSAQRCFARHAGVCRMMNDSTGDVHADAALSHAHSRLVRGLRACSDGLVAGMGFDAACTKSVRTRGDLAQCIDRTHRAAVQALVSVQFPQQAATCGDGVIDDVEDCDPVAVPTGCDTGETCGAAGSDDECLCVPATGDTCGDGTIDPGEQCDPGGSPSGCMVGFTCVAAGQPNACTCTSTGGSSCSGACDPACGTGQSCVCSCGSICGNGVTEPGEQCDPMANPSGCAAGLVCGAPGTATQCQCTSSSGTCGNGQLDPGEGCDPALPNTCDPGEVCLASGAMACTCGAPPSNCGNGLIEWGEQCDPAASPTGCGADESCGARGTPSACTCVSGGSPMCGNGTVDAGEACDPAASPTGCATGQTCSAGCTCSAPTNNCGNGTIDAGEACDPAANPTGCPAGMTCGSGCTCSTSGGGGGGGGNCALSPAPTTLTFTTAVGSGSCGQILSGSSAIAPLICGDLYFGGGLNTTVPPAPTPGGAPSVFDVSCSGSTLTLKGGAGSGHKDCTKSGCLFGPPLPIPNGPLSTCIVNSLSRDASGTVDASSGSVQISMALTSAVFLTQNDAAPCPICSGTCQDGPNTGLPCTPLGSANTSPDCPPGDTPLANLAVDLSPLVTGTASKTGPSYCSGQKHAGAFGKPNGSGITETGKPAGSLSGGGTASVTLGSVFCIPPTGNAALDPTADLPGPGAISLPGTITLR